MTGAGCRWDEALDYLARGIAELTSSAQWRSWLQVQARFHRYNFCNAVLIGVQRPTATRVAGFGTWRRLGRHVRRGEHAIWILAPVMRHETADDESGAEPVHVLAGFRPAPVFDVAQTEGEPLPDICTRLGGADPRCAYAGLCRVAASLGFAVEEHAFGDGTNGDCAHALRRIRIEQNLSPAHRVKTVAHELAYALLHAGVSDPSPGRTGGGVGRVRRLRGSGHRSRVLEFGYVASWAGGGEAALAAIKAAGTRIQQTAERVLASLVPDSDTETRASTLDAPAGQALAHAA